MAHASEDVARGLALLKAGRPTEAVPLLDRAAAAAPDMAPLHVLLGHAQAMLRALDDAAAAYRQALDIDPAPADVWYALGLVERDRAAFDAARACQEQVVARDPGHVEAHFELAQLLLLAGDYRRGFAEYEWRLKRPAAPDRPRPQPMWQGGDIAGRRVLVHGEQGMGDVLQMVRFLPALADKGARITLAVHASLVPLLRGMAGVERTIAIGEEPPDCALRVPLLSLPHRLGATLESLPSAPYIAAPDRPAPAAIAAASGPKVGLVWAGSPQHRNDRNRSLPFEALAPVTALPGCAFFGLQIGERAGDARKDTGIVDLSPQLGDVADTAAAIAALDLVIAVDTAVAHLAGAMGKPVWLLIPYVPDWRWMTARDDSPWYPSARLFRQATPGDWAPVIDRIVAALTG